MPCAACVCRAAEVALAKARMNEVKSKSRMLQQEKRNIYDQISAADDLKKQQQVGSTRCSALPARYAPLLHNRPPLCRNGTLPAQRSMLGWYFRTCECMV